MADDHITEDVIDHFCNMIGVEDGSGCWLWNGSRNVSGDNRGYGNFYVNGIGSINSHLMAYRIFNGENPNRLWVHHTCNNGDRGCVNPSHLQLATPAQNAQARILAGRGTNQKLDTQKVDFIRKGFKQGEGIYTLAKEFKVSEATIRQVIRGDPGDAWSWHNTDLS